MRQTIFNHDILTCTHELVLGHHLYSSRALGLTEPEDMIQLHLDLKSQWDAITSHYSRIGLNYSQNIIWDASLGVLANKNCNISVFYFGDCVCPDSYAADWFNRIDPEWFNVVKLMNSKNNFILLAQELGVSVPKTFCFENKGAIEDLTQFPYPCYLKLAFSVNGIGISRCENEQQLGSFVQTLWEHVPLQIQEEIAASSFLNLQYRVTASELQRVAVTSQILNGCVHVGNRYPSKHQPWETVEPIAKWMMQQGMKEVFAFDVAVVEDAAKTRYLAIECNPRFNGASYPTGIAKKLKIPSWSCETFITKYRSLEQINLSDIEFNAQSNTGVVLVNWGCILVGKISILLAGSIQEQNELRAILQQRL
ncbi:ATP-grasp domain-containing protein [Iningainema sp. BLCCT55]|uniref:ATP-grasp domain-containing protein n=1 Tax=Iningainema tapete BLCC-T55 TaxID=2748662 RepID=A0A8J6XJX4_9CYAN|nr:ATP-grasp domain-containing protein [Iningainema tapete BLCC-T55]